MAIEQATQFEQVGTDEVGPGRYVLSRDILKMAKQLHLNFTSKTNILASTCHEAPNTQGGSYTLAYHWAVRVKSLRHQFSVSIFSDGGYWRLYKVNSSGTRIYIGANASPNLGSPGTRTFSLSSSDIGADRMIRFEVLAWTSNNAAGTSGAPYLGLIMWENPSSTFITYETASATGQEMYMIDSDAVQPDETYSQILVQKLLENIETALRDRTRGHAVVYPVNNLPTISSVYWRGFGPFGFPVTARCSKATAVVTWAGGHGELTDGSIAAHFFSNKEKRSFGWIRENRAEQVINTYNSDDPRLNTPMIFEDIPCAGGQVNDFWLFFRSEVDEQASLVTPAFRWRYKAQAMGDVFQFDDVNSHITGSTQDLFEEWIVNSARFGTPWGFHLQVKVANSIDLEPEGGGSEVEFFNSDVYAPNHLGGSFDVAFDYALIRGIFGSGASVKLSFALSPSPDFIGLAAALSDGDGLVDGKREATAAIYRHALTRIHSVWINEEVDTGAALLGVNSVQGRTLPSASRMDQAITKLNELTFDAMEVYGMAPLTASCFEHDTDLEGLGDVFTKSSNWPCFWALRGVYEDPQDSGGADARPFTTVSVHPWRLPDDLSTTLLVPRALKVRILFQWNRAGWQYSDDTFPMRLFFVAFLSHTPLTSVNHLSDEILSRTEIEIDPEYGYRQEDIKTHTNWAAYVLGDEAGRSRNGLVCASASSYGWPEEICEDAEPFDSAEMLVDLAPLLDNRTDPLPGVIDDLEQEVWYLHVQVALYHWHAAGAGYEAVQTIDIVNENGDTVEVDVFSRNPNPKGSVTVPGVSITPYRLVDE